MAKLQLMLFQCRDRWVLGVWSRLDHAKDKDTYTHASSCPSPHQSIGLVKEVARWETGDPAKWG